MKSDKALQKFMDSEKDTYHSKALETMKERKAREELEAILAGEVEDASGSRPTRAITSRKIIRTICDPVGEFTKALATALPTLPHGEELGIGTITMN